MATYNNEDETNVDYMDNNNTDNNINTDTQH